MVARILVSMGGTVAEELVFGRDQVRAHSIIDTLQPGDTSVLSAQLCGLVCPVSLMSMSAQEPQVTCTPLHVFSSLLPV
jgi:hypothetical protein